jgi:WD40 repeat protein
VLAWTETGTVQMWDAINAESVFSLEHGNPVSGAIWSDDGTRLLVWSEDGSICAYLIDLEQLLQLAQSYHVRPLSNEEREIFFLPALEPTPPPE